MTPSATPENYTTLTDVTRRLDALFSETLACNEGDPRIGIPPGRLRQRALGSMLEDLRAEQGIGVDIIAPSIDDVR